MVDATEKNQENTSPKVEFKEASFTAQIKPQAGPEVTETNVDFAARLADYKSTHKKKSVVFSSGGEALHGAVSLGAAGMLFNSGKQYLFAHGSHMADGNKVFEFSKTSLHRWVKWTAIMGAIVGAVVGAVRATNHNNKMDTQQFAEMVEAQRAAQQANGQQPQMVK